MSSTSAASREPAAFSDGPVVDGRVIATPTEGTRKSEGVVAATRDSSTVVVVAALAQGERERLANAYRRRERLRIAALVLVVLILITSLATLVYTGIIFHHCNTFHKPNSDSPVLYVLVTFLLSIVVVIEAVLSTVTALVLLVHLCRVPERVLLRAPFDHGKFVCLCISLVVLLLFSGFTFAVPILLAATEQEPKEPAALCIIPALRVAAYLVLLGVLGMNRRVR